MTASFFRRQVASLLVVATACAFSMPPARAGIDASFQGRVVQTDGISPRAGVTVNLVSDGGERVWTSTPTGDDGAFTIGAPAGSYDLVVATSEGAFRSPDQVVLQPGANRPLALSLNAQTTQSGFGSATGLTPWIKWVIVGAIGVAAILVIDELAEDNDEIPASPF